VIEHPRPKGRGPINLNSARMWKFLWRSEKEQEKENHIDGARGPPESHTNAGGGGGHFSGGDPLALKAGKGCVNA